MNLLSFENLDFIWKLIRWGLKIKIMHTEENQRYNEIVLMSKDLPFLGLVET